MPRPGPFRFRPSRLGIRARITGGSLVIAVLISGAAGILIYAQVQNIVTQGQSDVLRNIEAPYVTALASDKEDVDHPGPRQHVRVTDPTGVVKVDTLPKHLALHTEALERIGTHSISTPSGSYLVRVINVTSTRGEWRVVTAVSDDREVAILNQVAALLIASIAIINVVFGAASWLIGTVALSPVVRLRTSASELMTHAGGELLPVGPARDEIADLALTLNELIGQLRASAERERQIVSDASHEMRTPLAIMTTQLELAQAEASSLSQMRADVAAAQLTLTRLTSLATSLLELSRIDAQAAPGRARLDDLVAELADAADRGRLRVNGRDIQIDYASSIPAGDDSMHAAVSVPDFGRVLDNLVNNSLAAVTETGRIEVTLDFDDRHLVLRVTDDAGGMASDFVDRAFDRFSRAATNQSGTGAGLGLAIVEGIATVAEGSVQLDNRPGVGITVTVRFALSGTDS
ncbi:MAG TPA: HAMP domain-containing sensor histidine kinase [Pseudolysinimonas sp.]|nr:HAMP domain-containing sensor histidine kinase [Pseudolysinimonas sp.]